MANEYKFEFEFEFKGEVFDGDDEVEDEGGSDFEGVEFDERTGMAVQYDEDGERIEPDDDDDEIEFADPGGNSALRAASERNPRNLPCPTCERPNRLTPLDVMRGYQCDRCADIAERGGC